MDESYLTRKLRFGASLQPADAERLDRLSSMARPVDARIDLISECEKPRFVHIVVSGMACRYKVLPDGRRSIVALMLPGDFCDLHVSILGRMDHSIGTLLDSEIVRVSEDELAALLEHFPAINRACWWATLVDESVLREWLVNVGRRQSDKQLAHLFCELYTRLAAVGLASSNQFRMPLTHEMLADLLGISPVHVQRVMKGLRDDDLISLQDRRITFPDFDATANFAEFNSGYLHLAAPD